MKTKRTRRHPRETKSEMAMIGMAHCHRLVVIDDAISAMFDAGLLTEERAEALRIAQFHLTIEAEEWMEDASR